MHSYQPLSDSDPDREWDSSSAHPTKITSLAISQQQQCLDPAASTIPPPLPPCPLPCAYNYPELPPASLRHRRVFILSLPVAIALLISTSVYYLYTTPIQLTPHVESLIQDQHQKDKTITATTTTTIFGHGRLDILSSSPSWSSWIPFTSSADNESKKTRYVESSQANEARGAPVAAVQTWPETEIEKPESKLDGIEIMTSFETEELSCSRNSVRVHNDDDAYDEDDDDDYDDSDDDVDYDEDSEDDSADEDDSDDEHEADDNVGQTETAIEDIVEKLEAMIIEETAKLEGLIGLGQDQLPLQESPKYGEDPEDTFIVTIKDLSGRSVVEPEDVNSILEDNGDDVVVLFGQDFSLARRHNHKVHSTGKGKRKRKAKGKRKAGERVDGEEVDTGEEETDEDEDDHFRSNQSHGDDDDDDDDNNDDDNDNAGQDGEEDDRGEGQEPSNNDHHHGMDKDRAKAKAKDKDKDKENSKNKDKHSSSHDDKLKHQDQQRQNANLGSTGGNGPILLCSSRSCLPGLRDSILSKISVQIHQVLTHLNNQEILLHMMEDTAPQTKESLIAGQEELVQQLEDGIMRDLKDWVNGAGSYSHNEEKKNKETEESSSAGDVPSKEKSNNVDTVSAASAPSSASTSEHDDNNVDNDDNDDMKNAEITVEFLGGDDGYESQVGNMGGFQMVGLDLEDEDDDDEDHEFDSHNTASDKKKQAHPRQPSKHSNHKDDTITQLVKRAEGNKGSSTSTSAGGRISDNSGSQEYFLSADILLMRQEWSRWIVHWVHHTKLLILSHTLARRTLTDMNQIAISGGNVVSQDQRHWAWNLDKALATVMVASEMLCGGRSEPKAVVDFLSTLSVAGETMRRPSLMTPQSVELTANAQKCIEAWRQDLEDILKRTATVA